MGLKPKQYEDNVVNTFNSSNNSHKAIDTQLPHSNASISPFDDELDSNLKTSLKSTGLLLGGTIFDTILGLICTILIARFFSVGEYGIYSLTVFLIVFFYGISGLGIFEANSRFISFYRGKNDYKKVQGVIKTSFVLVGISSTLIAITLFFLSDFIAVTVFGINDLAIVMRIFVISVPLWAITKTIVSVFRGFESTKEKVYFTFISLQILKVIFFISVIYLGLTLEYIFIGFLFAVLITFLIAMMYYYKNYKKFFKKDIDTDKSNWCFKEMLSFSWPLIFSGLAWFLISGFDKIMLGILTSEVEVGYYNGATPIARHLIFFYTITVFIFQPIASKLYAQKNIQELKRYYQVLTKWIFTLAFPFIMVLLLFPETIITLFYGSKYIIASQALQLMTIGIMIYLLLALSAEVITVLGKTKIILLFTLIGGGINIILNYLLIPLYGINGAAFATMTSFIIINGSLGFYLYKTTRIHPFPRNTIVPVIISLGILCICYMFILVYELNALSLFMKISICFLLIILYFIIVLKTRSYDKEDIQLFMYLEKKMGIRFKPIFNIIRKFIKVFIS